MTKKKKRRRRASFGIENIKLKVVNLNGDSTVLGALQTEVSALERHTLSLAKDCLPSNKLKKESAAQDNRRLIHLAPLLSVEETPAGEQWLDHQ